MFQPKLRNLGAHQVLSLMVSGCRIPILRALIQRSHTAISIEMLVCGIYSHYVMRSELRTLPPPLGLFVERGKGD